MPTPTRTVLLLALVACGCAGEAELPPGVPVVPAPLPSVDGGAQFREQCAAAGCGEACEPVADGGVACGVVCGARCSSLCAASRCRTSAGWVDATCTNTAGARSWSSDPHCDDGNPCTDNDVCVAGACIGPPAPATTACDDGDICTGSDRCDGRGGCAGAKLTADPIDRFLNSASESNYAYGPPGSFTGFGYADQLTIFHSSAAGDLDIHELHDAATDRILSPHPSEAGGFPGTANASDDMVIGKGFSTQVGGTVPLLRFKLPAGSGHCTSDTQCHFFTANVGEAPGGATQEPSGIFVCPP